MSKCHFFTSEDPKILQSKPNLRGARKGIAQLCIEFKNIHVFQSKFNKEKAPTRSLKFPAPLGMDDIERKISNDYVKFFDQIKQQLSNDSQKLKT